MTKPGAAIEPLLPTVYAGARRHDDRRIVSGIVHVLRSGCRWKDCPAVYGPSTTVYNRFNRWSGRGLWQGIFDTLAGTVADDTRSIDSTSIKVQRSATGGEGGASEQAIGRSRWRQNDQNLWCCRQSGAIVALYPDRGERTCA
jgi:transposase